MALYWHKSQGPSKRGLKETNAMQCKANVITLGSNLKTNKFCRFDQKLSIFGNLKMIIFLQVGTMPQTPKHHWKQFLVFLELSIVRIWDTLKWHSSGLVELKRVKTVLELNFNFSIMNYYQNVESD